KVAGLPMLSGWAFRTIVMAIAIAIWIAWTWRHAIRTRRPPEAGDAAHTSLPARGWAVLAIVVVTFLVFIYGVISLGWDFDQMAALFFAMGIVAGFSGGLGIGGTAQGFVNGFGTMAYAAILIGFARSIFLALDQGRIVDTIVYRLVTPLQPLPVTACAIGMMAVQAVLHFPVPSVSGQAVLTMPVLVPVSDLIGLSRQVTVLAFQYGAGLTEIITPTNGAVVGVVAAAGVKFGDWLSFAVPIYLLMLVFGALAIGVAIVVHFA